MYCQKCGKQMEEGSRFCPCCGAKNVEEPLQKVRENAVRQTVPVTKEKKKKKVLPVVVAAVVVLLMGTMILPDRKKTDDVKGKIVRSEEGTEGEALPGQESIIDLAGYAGYTEDELVSELGYEKNEYGIYPDEEYMNFMFTDGELYLITLNKRKDTGMSLFGVGFEDSVEEADAVLTDKGFVRQGSYESSDIARDGSLESVQVTVTVYKENATGYLYTVESDADNRITSLMYSTDTEGMMDEGQHSGSLSDEEPLWEVQPDQELSGEEEESAGQITYGTYFYEDGTGTTCDAEIGFYTDQDGDYISIDCWRNDRNIVPFTGILEEIGDGTYCAYDEQIGTEIGIMFVDGGMYVTVCYSDFPDADELDGFYILQKELNLNEVS